MNPDEWRDFLHELSRVLLQKDNPQNTDVNRPQFSPEIHAAGYIGLPGATEEQIAEAEARLGVRFPPSYRAFLGVSNGWPVMWHSVEPGQLWSTEQICWARDQDPELVEVWGEAYYEVPPELHIADRDDPNFRHQYVAGLLSISEHGDSDLLLSPEVVDEDGEWECWLIAAWIPGAQRHRSFKAWFQSTYEFHLEND